MTERLQKFLAHAGVASRRAAEALILEGRVTINGAVVTELGTKVEPTDAVKLDGRRVVARREPATWLALHKPKGYVTTVSDPEGRPTVMDLLPRGLGRIYPVGRLDYHSEGLVLMTDDGELAHRLTHPSRHVPRTYAVKVRGTPTADALARLAAGLPLHGRRTAPATVAIARAGHNCWLTVTVTEGRKHLVREMCRAVGHPVQKLRRTAFDGVLLGNLPPGASRPLTPLELRSLRAAARSAGRGGPRPRGGLGPEK